MKTSDALLIFAGLPFLLGKRSQLGSSNRNYLLEKLPKDTWLSIYEISNIWNMSEDKTSRIVYVMHKKNGVLIYNIGLDRYMRK